MAHLEGERTWVVQGRAVQLPVSFDARATAAVFRADRSAVAELLSGTPLRPAALGRQAVSVLLCAHYGRGDLGSYDEVGVGVLARDAVGRTGLYLCDLPVTQEFTLEAGQDIWGLPKWLMTAELALSDRETTTSISDRGEPVLRAALRHRGLPVASPLPVPVPTWAYPDRGAQAGVLLRGALLLGLSRVRVGRGELTLELGGHAMADRMRLLGMPSGPWVCVTARIHGTLGASRPTVAG
jgi:hypothetical protein